MFGFLILVTLIVEVAVLTYFEYISWNTIYTPMCCLMLPYTFVLLISILVSGNSYFVDFYYPSIFIWNIGLMLFAVPSYILALLRLKKPSVFRTNIQEEFPPFFVFISVMLSLAFFFRFRQVLGSSIYMFGTDGFAEDFSGHGIWAHLREIIMPLLILAIYQVKKRQWGLWIIIAALLLIQFLYMVKGAVIISVVSGLCLRLYAGKTHLKLTFLAKLFIGGFAIFLITYMVLPLMGNEDGEADMQLFEFVTEHFFHYLTSGTLGFSYDLELGCPDKGDFDIIISPFINIYNTIACNEELLSPVNPVYHNTGINLTNVRTFFGTLYVYSNFGQFTIYTIVISTIIYSIKLIAMYTNNIFLYVILFYYCGLLAMGWFEFYFFHLSIIEIPIITIGLWFITKLTKISIAGKKS